MLEIEERERERKGANLTDVNLEIEERPYVQLEPTQSPISPPYVRSVALKKQGLGKSGIYFTVEESEQ
uniref:Uncharacterized protein n=1 Tax=Timema douglasi TaxID=61478 RepID=A0A7R8VSM6_TIMDO|nr:unnamed protein product [Timema douglasi]